MSAARTPAELVAAIRALDQAATPGPWAFDNDESAALISIDYDHGHLGEEIADCGGTRDPDRDLIAAYRSLAPEAAATIERLAAENVAVGDALAILTAHFAGDEALAGSPLRIAREALQATQGGKP